MRHAVVWIDDKEARLFTVDKTLEQSVVKARGPHIHRHAKAEEVRARNHPDDAHRFFHAVAQALADDDQVLVVGPAQAKLHFFKYVQQHEHAIEPKIVGLETVDHPTDAQLVAHLRQYFHEAKPRRGVEP